MEYEVDINGLCVHAVYSEKEISEIFVPLLKKITQMQEEKGKRIIVFLAAPPGAGKSTLADFLQRLSCSLPDVKELTAIGMDGFHRYQQDLMTSTTIRQGKEISLVQIKGHPMTFQLERLKQFLHNTAQGGDVWWPVYNRLTHNPQENAVCVHGDIILVEGNYLLLDEIGWKDLRAYADLTICIEAQPELLRERLIARKQASGVERVDAQKFVDFSDMFNARLCLEHSLPADITLRLHKGNSFELVADKTAKERR